MVLLLLLLCAVVPTGSAQPANDSFAQRSPLVGTNVVVTGSLAGATSEPGEPLIDGISSGQTAWWTWTAPSNGIVTLSVTDSVYNLLLSVYSGDDLADLSLVATNNYLMCYQYNCGCFYRLRDHVTFHVSRGQTYQIQADEPEFIDVTWNLFGTPLGSFTMFGYGPQVETNRLAGGDFALGLQFTPAPPNDDFDHATKLTGSRLHIMASNAGATKQPGEPDHFGNPGGSSVWYTWTAPVSGRLTISTNEIAPYSPPTWYGFPYGFGTQFYGTWSVFGGYPTCGAEIDQNPPPDFFPVFDAYTGSAVNALTEVGALSYTISGTSAAIAFDVVRGQSYDIAYDGNLGTTGDINLYLALTPPPPNDDFANRIVVHGIVVVATGYNAGATHQAGEPVSDGSLGKSAWWSWMAPVSGLVTIDLGGSDLSFPVSVYTGGTLNSLQPVATGAGQVSFQAVDGQTYQIAISDLGGQTGAITYKLTAPILELPLIGLTRGKIPTLQYASLPGQIILLQFSPDRLTWQNLSSRTSSGNSVTFSVPAVPGMTASSYRAIVIDRVPAASPAHGAAPTQ